MKFRLILLFLLTAAGPAQAEQMTLDFLYEPSLEHKQQLLLDRIVTHARNAEFDYALTLSQALLEEAEPLRETSATKFGQILVNHGIIQSAAEDYDLGLPVIERGLGFMERHTKPFSRLLINGIMAKGLTQLSMGSAEEAEDTFRRAQHIMHRQSGVYAAEQMGVVSLLTTTQIKRGDLAGADRQQQFSLRVAEQVYGADSIELLPVLNRLGSHFATRGSLIPLPIQPDFRSPIAPNQPRMERNLLFKYSVLMYRRAITIIEQNFGENDLRLVQPLRGLANARMQQVTSRKYSEGALKRSLEIVQSHPDSDITDRAQALVDLGDLYIITSDARASELYLQAWDLLQENTRSQAIADMLFGTPTRLLPREIPVLYLDRRPDSAGENGALFADVEYSINAIGEVSHIKVIEKNVPNEQVRLLRHRIRGARYRPRIIDAEIVETHGLLFHQPFQALRRSTTSVAQADDEHIEPSADHQETSFEAEALKKETTPEIPEDE